jgi:hypothetical protein
MKYRIRTILWGTSIISIKQVFIVKLKYEENYKPDLVVDVVPNIQLLEAEVLGI